MRAQCEVDDASAACLVVRFSVDVRRWVGETKTAGM
jgi:hypothetical protein